MKLERWITCFRSPVTLAKGCGVFRIQLNKFSNADHTSPAGCLIGLILNTAENQDKLNNQTIVEGDFSFAIRTNPNNLSNANYLVKKSLATDFVDSLVQPIKTDNDSNKANNDILDISISTGRLSLMRHTPAGTTLLHSQNYDFGTADKFDKYICVVGIYGDSTTTRLSAVNTIIDPFDHGAQQNFPNQTEELQGFPINNRSSQVRNTITTYNLTFDDIELANYFGFNSVVMNPLARTSVDATYIADNLFSKNIGTNTYLVELLNINISSYHTASATQQTNQEIGGGRKSILASIPISERIINSSGQIQYEPNNPFYISLNNKFPLNLRNIKARIISNDFSPIQTDGISEMSILIKESD